MPDIFSSLQVAVDISKKLRALSEKVKDAEIKMLLADLQSELADMKLEAAGLKERLATLTEENAKLVSQLELRSQDTPEMMPGGYKFGGIGPFCASCFEKSGKKIQLPRSVGIHTNFGAWTCPVCKNHS